MNPQLTPEQALSILLRNASAAHAAGATNANDIEAAVVAAKVLANALAPKPETTTSSTDSPGECGGDVVVPDGRKRRKKSG